jgi:hypothetical protein
LASQLLLRELELVERAVPGVVDHVGQHVGLDLVLRGLQPGQQWDARRTTRCEASDGQRLHVEAELLDPSLQFLGVASQCCGFVLQHLEIRLRLQERRSGGVGAVAGGLDLPRSLLGRIVGCLCGDGDVGQGGHHRTPIARIATATTTARRRGVRTRPTDTDAPRPAGGTASGGVISG